MGEDLGPRQRHLEGGYGRLIAAAARRVARFAWKLIVVLVLTVTVLWAIGWAIQTTRGPSDDSVTTVEDR